MSTSAYVTLLLAGGLLAALALSLMARRRSWGSLTGWIVAAVGAGIAIGAAFQYHAPQVFQADLATLDSGDAAIRQLTAFFKQFFLNALKMIVVPLIFSSIVSGVLTVGRGEGLGRLGAKTLGYYVLTSLLAILTGLFLVNTIQPGAGASLTLSAQVPDLDRIVAPGGPVDFITQFLLGIIPTNPVEAMASGNILQVIVFAFLVGLCITRIPDPWQGTLSRFFEGFFQVMMKVVWIVFWLAPLGIGAIFVMVVGETGPGAFLDLGLYAATVMAGLSVHMFVTLPLLLLLIGRVHPVRHFKAMGPALVTAFSTSSSSATLPLTMRCVEKRAGVSNRVTSFVLPLGATVNMDGTALYECVAAVFIAQIYVTNGEMPPLDAGQQFLIVVTALAASIGAAGIPMAGLVMMTIVLNAIGLPNEAIGYVIAVDRILDMCRTATNVWSDACGAAIIARTEGETGVLSTWPPPEDGD